MQYGNEDGTSPEIVDQGAFLRLVGELYVQLRLTQDALQMIKAENEKLKKKLQM